MTEEKIITIDTERVPILQVIGAFLLFYWTVTGDIPWQLTTCLVLFNTGFFNINFNKVLNDLIKKIGVLL
ncbi:hypothetical protein V3O24_04740 [Methylobacter sp. Wu8]|uniref:hypothetical protein n=1 Tax=Methylobacter sp. Wu8 TaxID=3118457 RepID=UPI002F34D8CE